MSTNDSSTLQAYVAGTRRVLITQLLIAIALVAISGWAAYNLWNIRADTAEANKTLQGVRTQLGDAQGDMANFLAARPDFRTGAAALDVAARETDATLRQTALETALISLTSAAQKAKGADPDICRYLSRAQYFNGQPQAALASLQAAMNPPTTAMPAEQTPCTASAPPQPISLSPATAASSDAQRAVQEQRLLDSAWLSTFYCAVGNAAGAREIVANPDFVGYARDPSFAQSVPLNAACGHALPAEVAALQPGAAETALVAQDQTSAFSIRTIFIQYVRAEDRAKVDQVRAALIVAHYQVPTPELIEGARAGVIRYYYDAQQHQADEILRLVTAQMQSLNWGGDLRRMRSSSLAGRFPNLRHDRAELWLPAGGDQTQTSPAQAPLDPRREVQRPPG